MTGIQESEGITVTDTFDFLLTGGTVLNPATKLNQKLDVGSRAIGSRRFKPICRAAGRSA